MLQLLLTLVLKQLSFEASDRALKLLLLGHQELYLPGKLWHEVVVFIPLRLD